MFLDDLAKSNRPAILCGGGAYHARDAIIAFAQHHAIPCFRTWNALDIITDDCGVYAGTVGTYGGPGRNFGIQNCDLLLSLGCKMGGKITGGLPESFARGAKRYIVDVDANMLEPELQQVRGHENVLMDCVEYINSMGSANVRFEAWMERCVGWRDKYDPVAAYSHDDGHHYTFMRRLSESLPSDAIVVYDTGGNAIMMGHCFRSKRGQRIFSSNGNTPMGFSMCGAIGAWFTEPLRPIVCIIGDGGMSMNIQELQTIVNYGVKLQIYVINNHILGNTKSYQRVNGMKEVGCGPDGYKPPDFVAVAKAYGVPIHDIVHHDFCTYEPRVSRWDCGIEESYPPLPVDEWLSNMLIEPLPGWEARR